MSGSIVTGAWCLVPGASRLPAVDLTGGRDQRVVDGGTLVVQRASTLPHRQ